MWHSNTRLQMMIQMDGWSAESLMGARVYANICKVSWR
jgi:hypothetical protein